MVAPGLMAGPPAGARADDEALFELQQTLYTSKNPTRRWLHVARRRWITDAIWRCSEGGVGQAMEVGPGSGVYLPVLADVAGEVVALDAELAYLDRLRPLAQDHPNIRFVHDDITRASVNSNSFDLVLCTEVIEHIRDADAALAEMHRILRPGGSLILSTPQRFSPLELTAKIAFLPGVIEVVRRVYSEPVLETGHINLMTRRTLRRRLERAGFTVTETYLAGVYIPVAAEALGEVALRFERWLEPRLRRSPFAWLLWTQHVVAVA